MRDSRGVICNVQRTARGDAQQRGLCGVRLNLAVIGRNSYGGLSHGDKDEEIVSQEEGASRSEGTFVWTESWRQAIGEAQDGQAGCSQAQKSVASQA
jgi:hypothetical protein